MTGKNPSKFWSDLLKKILKILLKDVGIRPASRSYIQHVVPHPEGWAVKGAGNERYTAVYKYQEDAIDRAKDIAKKLQIFSSYSQKRWEYKR